MRKHQVVPKLNKRGENLKMFSNFAIELGFWQYFGTFVAMEGLRRQGMSFSTCVKEQQSQTCYLAYKFCFKYFCCCFCCCCCCMVLFSLYFWHFFFFSFFSGTFLHGSFYIWLVKTESDFIVKSVETDLGRWMLVVAVISFDVSYFLFSHTWPFTLMAQE